ncbi:MAG: tRNA (adenosine(37)-N6)-dimethylallyltransferase MiaA [Nocardioides sp.]
MSPDALQAVPVIVAISGPTAAGKSELALDLAAAVGGEIVNTDAMALYRGMDIGTAKQPETERRGIRHHLLDLLDVTQPATVAEFQGRARDAIVGIRRRGRTPVLVGGSALYTRAVLDRFEFPGTDAEVRAALERDLAEEGLAALYDRLGRLDPEAAAKIQPDNARRIVRALEVIELSGQPFGASLPPLAYADPRTVQLGIAIDREVLDRRIALRVESMFDRGFVGEVAGLLDRGLMSGRTASRAIGYREVAAHLAGECSLAEARERTVRATRRFARRQATWHRRDPRIVWLRWDDPDRLARALHVIEGVAAD